MDFMSGLPRSKKGYKSILVIVDSLTYSAHIVPINMKLSLEKLAKLYFNESGRRHRILISILADRNPRFVFQFCKQMQGALGTKLSLGTTYHLQTNGQLERTIHTLEDMLRACVMDFGG